MRFLISLLAVSLCLGTFGYSWQEFDGTGEWPTSGDIMIPANVTITVDDEHVDAVAGWNNVYLSNTKSMLVFANATKPATYNAADTCANGVLRAENSCGLRITSTNPGQKFKNGHYEFYNSRVTVVHENGLCPGSSARLYFLASAENNGNLSFHDAKWDEPGFTGVKAITNHCQILIDQVAESGKVRAYVGSDAMDEYFVQDAGLYIVPNTSNKYLGLRNNYEQISGEFGTCNESWSVNVYTGQSPWYSTTLGAQIRFSGTTAITQNGPNAVLSMLCLGSSSDWYFGMSSGYHATSFSQNIGVCHILADNVFHDTDASTIPTPPDKLVVLTPYIHDQTTVADTNAWNLHGHTFTIASIGNANNGVTATSTGFDVFESAEPATLVLAEGWYKYYGGATTKCTTRGATSTCAALFTGAVSVEIANAATNVFATKVSTSTGTMTVRNDSTAEFKWKGGWGSRLVVEESGQVILDESNTALSAWPELEIAAGGKLVLAAGVTAVKFASFKCGETDIPEGDYTIGSLKAKYGIGDFVDAADAVTVEVGFWQEFDGTGEWPTTGKIEIPKSKCVAVDDAHVDAVAGWTGLRFAGTASRLSFVNTSVPAVLNAAEIIGSGAIEAMDSCKLTINAANETGKFHGICRFTNSNVVVTHDFGLGDNGAKAYLYYYDYDVNKGNLSFHKPEWDESGFTGVKAITNRCQLFFGQTDTAKNYQKVRPYVGSDALDEYFVQDASVYVVPKGGYRMLGLKNNYEQISGEFGTCSEGYTPNSWMGQHPWYAGTAGAQIRFSGTTVIQNNAPGQVLGCVILGGSADWYFGMSGGYHGTGFSPNVGVFHILADNVFHDTANSTIPAPPEKYVSLAPYVQEQAGLASTNAFNLHGHTLTLSGISVSAGGVTETSKGYDVFESAEPATIRLAEGWCNYYGGDATKYTTRGRSFLGAPQFTGAISVEAANAATNVFATRVSRPSGTLTVSNDTTVLFKWGGAWAGGIAVADTGRLVVEASAGAFNGAKVEVAEGGEIEIADGKTVEVDTLVYRGVKFGRGRFTKNSPGCAFLTGGGTLRVRNPDEGVLLIVR